MYSLPLSQVAKPTEGHAPQATPLRMLRRSFASWLINTTTTRLNSALLLGADLIDFQGKKIDLQSNELELLGVENDELRAQVARVKDLLSA